MRTDGALDVGADLRAGVVEKILPGQALVASGRKYELGDPTGGDGEGANAARAAAEPCPKGGEFRRCDPLIGADAFIHEGLERLQDGQAAVDFRAEGSALDRQEFRRPEGVFRR